MILMKNLILILIFAAVGLNTMASNPVHVIITAGKSSLGVRPSVLDCPAVIITCTGLEAIVPVALFLWFSRNSHSV